MKITLKIFQHWLTTLPLNDVATSVAAIHSKLEQLPQLKNPVDEQFAMLVLSRPSIQFLSVCLTQSREKRLLNFALLSCYYHIGLRVHELSSKNLLGFIQHYMQYCLQVFFLSLVTKKEFPSFLLKQAYAFYNKACEMNLARSIFTNDLHGELGAESIDSMFKKILLLCVARLSNLSMSDKYDYQCQMQNWLACVDLSAIDKDTFPVWIENYDKQDPEGVGLSLKTLGQKLKQCSHTVSNTLADHLAKQWCYLRRRSFLRRSTDYAGTAVVGFMQIVNVLNGKLQQQIKFTVRNSSVDGYGLLLEGESASLLLPGQLLLLLQDRKILAKVMWQATIAGSVQVGIKLLSPRIYPGTLRDLLLGKNYSALLLEAEFTMHRGTLIMASEQVRPQQIMQLITPRASLLIQLLEPVVNHGGLSQYHYQSIKCNTRPSASLGENQVDLGGITLSASATWNN